MQPLSDFVFLKYEKKEQTKSGVYVSDVSRSKPARFEVVAVGPGKLNRMGNFVATTLKPGDTILCNPFEPREFEDEGKKYYITRESEIFAKI